jgi:glycosyltransferase involved in cell wall biosynthesis
MSHTPKITCCCPTHGRAHILGEAVESFLRQEPCGFETELLILNDCPEQPLKCATPGVRVVNLEDPMPVNAKFDLAVEMARGQWIAWWEDDDISLPHRLLRSVQRSGMERPYKQQTAWLWGQNGLAGVTRNLLFGTAFFSKRLYLECGGAGTEGGPDAVAYGNIGRRVRWENELAAAGEIFFVYRWGGVAVVHDSGFTGVAGLETPEAKLAAFRDRTLNHPDFRPGEQTVVPGWQVDYAALIQDSISRILEKRGPKKWWEANRERCAAEKGVGE